MSATLSAEKLTLITQIPGRIQKADPPQSSVIYTIVLLSAQNWRSTFWSLQRVWVADSKVRAARDLGQELLAVAGVKLRQSGLLLRNLD